MTTTKPRWTRVLNGWYSLNLRTATGLFSAEVIQTELGLWAVKVNEREVGMTDSLKSAKSLALAVA
ncbi:hypothetical protein LRP67_16150 [Nocardioides sp. cx-169]|uniref:hypothetical protein n=1 Tax=Nocardioides sp. cx-169 TaxID=2899080 RepID=UPI001E3FBCA8|nr:hypothetical protein [Nocardioides sp. cx-169]MCD4535625.1 hypothetical protein [Nocardioides sp. cx-169]